MFMDAKTAEKVSKLAKQLKDLHMAGSIEEATARAKEIIEKAESGKGRPINEMMKTELEDIKQELKELKKDAVKDAQEHELDKEYFKKVKKKSDESKQDVEEMEKVSENAKKAQEKK